MRFKNWIETVVGTKQSNGLYGSISGNSGNLFKNAISIKGKGTTVGRVVGRFASVVKPSLPTSGVGYKSPQKINSII